MSQASGPGVHRIYWAGGYSGLTASSSPRPVISPVGHMSSDDSFRTPPSLADWPPCKSAFHPSHERASLSFFFPASTYQGRDCQTCCGGTFLCALLDAPVSTSTLACLLPSKHLFLLPALALVNGSFVIGPVLLLPSWLQRQRPLPLHPLHGKLSAPHVRWKLLSLDFVSQQHAALLLCCSNLQSSCPS